jgi:hypothetical protein
MLERDPKVRPTAGEAAEQLAAGFETVVSLPPPVSR